MAKTTPKPTLELPCANPACGHLHEGIPCMETGCECKTYVKPEIPAPSDAAPEPKAIANETIPGSQETFPGNPAVLFAGDATIQQRVGQLLEAFEVLGEPVGCDLTLFSDEKFKWTGSEMVKVVDKPAVPAPVPTLSDEDVAKLREVVNQQNPAIELPDGSLRLSIVVDPDTVNIIKSWAEDAGEPFQTYLQRAVEIGLNATVNGGSVAG